MPESLALGHLVHRRLEALIISRTLKPGVRLVEGDLAKTLGVSRGPIREALQLLASDGFVELRPRQGAFVRVPTFDEVENFYDVRLVLEVESARLAAIRITPEGTAALRERIALAHSLLEEGSDPSMPTPYLHSMIAEIAANPTLTSLLHLLQRRSTWYLSPFQIERRRKAWEDHERIVEAIMRGDAKEAQKAMRAHILTGFQTFRALSAGDS